MKRVICLLLVCCTLLVFGACGNKEVSDGSTSVTFTDDLGRKVTVDRPQRVACLIGSFADIWHLAGGTDTIVATAADTWTYFDIPLGEDVINLGPTKELDLDLLKQSQPDFVIASCNTPLDVELESTFKKMGLKVAYFRVSTFDDYLEMLEICTRITGCTDNYDLYGEPVRARIENAIVRADGSNPKVLCIRVTGSGCQAKTSEGNILGEMLYDLDCLNIADQDENLQAQLDLEAVALADPDYIFVVLQSSDPKAAEQVLQSTLLSNPLWQSLRAVHSEQFYILDPVLFNLKPNDRWGEAYEALADILYP